MKKDALSVIPRLLAPMLLALVFLIRPETALAAGEGLQWPSFSEFMRVISLQDYNTRVVILGTTLLGFSAGLTGTFLMLRKRALLSDALSHATLPGIVLAFMIMSVVLGNGKHLVGLIAGAAVFSVIGTVSVLVIQKYSRLKDDAALGIVLSVYFGLGVALMGLATRMASGDASGLNSFIYGKTASMLFSDAMLIAATALAAGLVCLLLFKEFALLCFDAGFAATQGWPVTRLDFLMMALVVVVTVVGLQAVGLILVVALLIIPPASARFWSHKLSAMLWLSGAFGALSGLLGAALSALMANLPAGAVIVLTASAFFVFSLVLGRARGLLHLGVQRYRLRRRIAFENLLRDIYEWLEAGDHLHGNGGIETAVPKDRIPGLGRLARRMIKEGWMRGEGEIRFTKKGFDQARQVVRRHRLWETYLITHADIAPGQVDFGADRIEHVLDPAMVARLENLMPGLSTANGPPKSPHRIKG